MSIWAKMSQIDIRSIQERKQGFTYLSWSHAWRLLKENVPHAKVIKHTFEVGGVMLPYMRDGSGFAYVMVTVDLGDGDVTTEIMPVLNHANKPIANPNSFEVNAQIQRCMAKAISMSTGLGIHLYAGEDLPRQPVEAVGADSSAQQTASGRVSATNHNSTKSMSLPSGFADPSVAEAQTPLKKSAVPLSQLIKLAPDMDALKDLFHRHKDNLSPEDKELFSARKKELLNG